MANSKKQAKTPTKINENETPTKIDQNETYDYMSICHLNTCNINDGLKLSKPFMNALIFEICSDQQCKDYRWTNASLTALQEASEAHLVKSLRPSCKTRNR